MSTAAYDLGRRLRAARESAPVANTVHAAALPPDRPVAVLIERTPDGPVVTAATDHGRSSARGSEALTALAALGVGLEETHRTLVVVDRSALDDLHELARSSARHPDLAPVAATVGWWTGRAEHPGSGAVIVLGEALRRRWTLGVPSEAERELSTWATWLRIAGDGPELLLALARAATGGSTLPGLLEGYQGSDVASWRWLCDHATTWHLPDGRGQAALGLATRCDAADLYASLLLDDPLVAARAAFTGEVVTGEVVSASPITIRADRALSRLRADADVDAWPGEAIDAALSPLSGRIASATVDPTGALHITLSGTGRQAVEVGSRLSLRARRVSPRQQSYARRERRVRQGAAGNWLATRECPPAARREVPLDIAVAAADE